MKKKLKMKNGITAMMVIDGIRELMSKCDAPEIELYGELCREAEGWNMRLREVEEEEKEP